MLVIWDDVYDAAKLSCTKGDAFEYFCAFNIIPCLWRMSTGALFSLIY